MAPGTTSRGGSRTGSQTIPLNHGGLERPYLLHAPATRSAGDVPLVVELHGRGIDPVAFDRWTGFTALADQAGFVLAMPRAGGGHTWPGNLQPLPRFLFGRTSHTFAATKVIWEFLSGHVREA